MFEESDDNPKPDFCRSPVKGVELFCLLFYSIAMLFLIFRYANVIIEVPLGQITNTNACSIFRSSSIEK